MFVVDKCLLFSEQILFPEYLPAVMGNSRILSDPLLYFIQVNK